MKQYIKTALLCLLALAAMAPQAFSRTSLKLDKDKGHYSLVTAVNGTPGTRVVLFSSIPGMMIAEGEFNRLFADSALALEPETAVDTVYFKAAKLRVSKALKGRVALGDSLSYQGPVYVIDGRIGIALPVHLLRNDSDPEADIIRLDFKKKTLDFLTPQEAGLDRLHSFKLVEYAPMPVFETSLELADTYGHSAGVSGRFVLSLENGSPFFFYKKNAARFLRSNKFTLLSAQDKACNTVGRGILAGYFKIGDKVARGISIGITDKLWRSDSVMGCAGPSLFDKGFILIDPRSQAIYFE